MWAPDRAWVINRECRTDRLDRFIARTVGVPFPIRLFTAVEPVLRPHWVASPAALGCALSHRAVLAESLATGETVLVLEDDAVLGPFFAPRLTRLMVQAPPDWQLLKLGGEHLSPPRELRDSAWVRCGVTVRTHAYLVRGPMIRRLVDVIDRSITHWDAIYGQLPAYAPRRFLVRVSGSRSDIPDSRPLVAS